MANPGPAAPADTSDIASLMGAGRLADALLRLEKRLEDNGDDDGEALYLAAVCERLRKNHDDAYRYLQRCLARAPEDGRSLQEMGHLYRDRRRPGEAVVFYERATQANPALLASYRNQLALLREAGREREAAIVESRLQRAATLPKALLAVTDLIAQGRILKAEEHCRAYLQRHPRDTEGMRLLADIGVRFGALDEAQFLLDTACELSPNDPSLRIELIRVLGKRQRFSQALEHAEHLLHSAPTNLQFRSIHAIELLQIGRYDEAIAGFDAILRELPGDAVTLTSRGHALKTCGATDRAIASYEAASEAVRGSGESWYALANLKTYRFDDAQLQRMEERLAEPAPLMDRVYLAFAMGKAYEDRGAFEESFVHYEHGNRLKGAQLGYRRETFTAEVDGQIEHTGRELFARHHESGHPAPDPIFIVGLPRAGSTLLEQILASHSLIDGTRELPNILSLAQRLRRRADAGGQRPGYPQILSGLDDAFLTQLGKEYLEDTRIHRGDAPFFIDKMPNNFRHIGLIHLMLPNARIIDARREPRACCFSNFKQLFAEGQEFSYDLANLGHYYRDYVRLMEHWNTVLPGRVHRLQHERLLDDLEGEVKALFDYLEIPFEAQCLRFYETDRPVRTPSSEQVRQPLFRDAQQQWQNYQPWLSPLLKILDGG